MLLGLVAYLRSEEYKEDVTLSDYVEKACRAGVEWKVC
jgi:hypothetical protein